MIKIDPKKPWLKQAEEQMIYKALKHTKGVREDAAELLGISKQWLGTKINTIPSLSEYKHKGFKQVDAQAISYFQAGLVIKEIAGALSVSPDKISRILTTYFGKDYSSILAKNRVQYRRRRKSMTISTEEIIKQNKSMMAQIAEKVREKHGLTDQQIEYARLLYNNGFMKKDGTITKEGITALYH